MLQQHVPEKENTSGADENLFRLVAVPGHGTRICAQTGPRARAPGMRTKSERGLNAPVRLGIGARSQAPCSGTKIDVVQTG